MTRTTDDAMDAISVPLLGSVHLLSLLVKGGILDNYEQAIGAIRSGGISINSSVVRDLNATVDAGDVVKCGEKLIFVGEEEYVDDESQSN